MVDGWSLFRRLGTAGVVAGSAWALVACGSGTTDEARPPASVAASASHSASLSPSPSPSCPSQDDFRAAANSYVEDTADSGLGSKMKVDQRACDRGYAVAVMQNPGANAVIFVVRRTDGRWRGIAMGSEICGGVTEDGGRTQPRWMVGAPDSVVRGAACRPEDYAARR